jgi:2-oxoglutarate dehydrogenase E1 component
MCGLGDLWAAERILLSENMSEPFDFVNRANAEYIDRMYEQYQRDPRGVDAHWQAFFAGFQLGLDRQVPGEASEPRGETNPDNLHMGIFDLVHSYRELGHFMAHLDPLGHNRGAHSLLELSNFGITTADLDKKVGTGGFMGPTDGTLRDLIEKLRATYCGTIGVEFTNISDKKQRDWLQARMEPILNKPKFSLAEQKSILFQLCAAEDFEQFLHTRFVGQKRFSLEGATTLIPMLNAIVEDAATLGADKVIMGMAHRGRLNTLAHVLNKPYEVILSEFKGTNVQNEHIGDGDVKYHLGFANERKLSNGLNIKVSLCPNPSHLELIDPIMQGIVRCQQSIFGDTGRSRVVPVVMHGDAAFTGQGVVSETLNLSELPGYRTGGTIHIIVNNQIGFTTDPEQGRFTPYPTDVAKMIQAPIFHVNGDDPEACVHAAKLAIGFRQEFKCDVMIDLWCFRRHGHNEGDEPSFTQPVMYREIEKHAPAREIYGKRLIEQSLIQPADTETMDRTVTNRLESALKLAEEVRPRQKIPSFGGVWAGLGRAIGDGSAKTAVPRDVLRKVAEATSKTPANFTIHPKLKRLLASRLEAVATGKGIDWGCAEMLAWGTLLLEGTPVRVTGQDVERGTFSHRHAVLHDYNTGDVYRPLSHLSEHQANFTILNTMLSEYAVLGFEWGYASADPRRLVIWEAQFGDFVNGAQPIIDQILVASESKWGYMNGLVINLPHGYEGAGAEHSNGYLERFLSLCADNNIQVAYPSLPSQYFHLLRRQINRKFRKPLVIMMPKKLLRLEAGLSKVDEFTDRDMQLVIDDPSNPDRAKVKRLLLCSGKVYFALTELREKSHREDVAIVRIEQLYPFPTRELQSTLSKYRNVQVVGWVQEEPQNRGAWSFMERRLRELLPQEMPLMYSGREESASSATGSSKIHEIEEQELLNHALDLAGRPTPPQNGPTTIAAPVKPIAISDQAAPAPPSEAAALAATSAAKK